MKILITGNNGFIGKALVQRLINDNDITGIDIGKCDNNDIEYILERKWNYEIYSYFRLAPRKKS